MNAIAADSLPQDPPRRLAENVVHFARVLRAAGMPVGPGRVIDALKAVELVGLDRREDLFWTLHTTLVDRHEHSALFAQAFTIFWRNPQLLERAMAMLLPQVRQDGPPEESETLRRLAEAMAPAQEQTRKDEQEQERIEVDATLTFSDKELLYARDFEAMGLAELAEAKAAMKRLAMPLSEVPTRRWDRDPRGKRIDFRASMRASLRSGGRDLLIVRQERRMVPPPLVALCDISGSMERYSRVLLHFLHALSQQRERVHSFVFGTRLTNITRQLKHRDIDDALARVAASVEDWSGGTRIAVTLANFNRLWSRRVLGQGAVVLLITDGLDRDAGQGLEPEMERLQKSCRRLVWLNPLLRYEGFQPKALGIRAMLPHVDDFRPVHNLNALTDLVAALSRPPGTESREPAPWTT
ncbi:vWA domain-containing protein [Zavarzinia sp. CC-PAN008]|uniref:vWA domain-containing protein n=1 Tax=Zavarzinia sp. CC-PAN008 TaxID=3243332 RepID=UPI003F746DE8